MMVKKIIETILLLFVILVMLVIILLQPNINFFPISVFGVKTGSMEPFINVDDIVLVKHTKDVKINDIVVYKKNNEYIIHRIIEINKNEIITKGDANNTNDKAITKDDIIGKYIRTLNILREVIILIKEYYYILISFFVGLTIALYIYNKS